LKFYFDKRLIAAKAKVETRGVHRAHFFALPCPVLKKVHLKYWVLPCPALRQDRAYGIL
jgi:hypothetical protein